MVLFLVEPDVPKKYPKSAGSSEHAQAAWLYGGAELNSALPYILRLGLSGQGKEVTCSSAESPY
jgi:hypothetical protein